MALWRHQIEAIQRLKPLTAAGLFMSMGCGKTLVAIELLKEWEVKQALIVAPKAVLPVWESEFAKHSPEWRVTVLDQQPLLRRYQELQASLRRNNGHKQAWVINYEAVWREPLGKWFMKNPPDVVVTDEGHRLKGPRGIASKYFSRLGPLVRRRLALTGTPLSHSPLDAYAIYRFLDPRIFGFSFTRFRARYAMMGGFGGHQVLKFINLEELHQKMYSIAYRALSKDVLDLPETMEQVITFALSERAQTIYDSLEQDLIAEVSPGKVISVPNVLAKLLRLQQLTGGYLQPDDAAKPARVDTGKAEVLQDLLEDMGQEPVVVFCRFHADLKAVHEVCRKLKIKYAELSGRKNELKEWTADQAQVLTAQIQSGGLGIDLTRSRYCIYYSTGWSLGDLEQSKARVHRPGQMRKVTYYYLTATKTIDEKIIKALQKRADLVAYVVDELRRK